MSEFEKYWFVPLEQQKENLSPKEIALDAWNARQPEIDALKEQGIYKDPKEASAGAPNAASVTN